MTDGWVDEKLPTGLSPSSIDLWLQCPRKFREEKVRGREGGTGEAALMGTYVHLILERLMQLPSGQRTVSAARELTLSAWDDFASTESWLGWAADNEPDLTSFRRRAWASVCGYFDIENPNGVEVLDTERFMSTTVEGVPLRGIVDRVDRDVFDDVVIVDYKTGKVPAPWFRASKFRQLNLYAAMYESLLGERPAEGRLLFTSFGEVIGTTIDAESTAAAVEVASTAWVEIGDSFAAGRWDASPGPLCGWCPFVAECEAGLAEVRARRAAGKLKQSAPAWELAGEPVE
jgi:putative RecB family exonuclease